MYSKSRFLCVFCRRIVKARKVDRALRNVFCIVTLSIVIYVDNRGGSRGARIRRPPPPPPHPPPKILKNKIFWHKIVIFHTKYPKIFRASLRSAQFLKIYPPNLKSWIRPWTIYVFAEKQTRNAHQRLSSVV